MIDELDLAFDEHAERGRPRHRRGARAGKKSSGKSAVAFLMAFILLAVLGVGGFFAYTKVKGFFTAADYDGAGTDPVQVTIAKGSTLSDIGNSLVDADVVKSTKAFTNAANDNPRGKNIQDGTYRLRKQMSAKNAVTALLDPKARITSGVTIPEGKTAKQTIDLLSKATNIPVKNFEDAAKDPTKLGVQPWWFNRRDHKPAAKTIEGFLYPDTYEFDPKMDATAILSTMVDRFNAEMQDLGFADTVQKNLSVSPFEGLIVASLTQAESGTTADMSKIARVAYNRAYKAHMPLGSTPPRTTGWNSTAGRPSTRVSSPGRSCTTGRTRTTRPTTRACRSGPSTAPAKRRCRPPWPRPPARGSTSWRSTRRATRPSRPPSTSTRRTSGGRAPTASRCAETPAVLTCLQC